MTLAYSTSIGDLKTGPNYWWFRRDSCPPHQSELLGAYYIRQIDRVGWKFLFRPQERSNLIVNLSIYLSSFTKRSYGDFLATGNGQWPIFDWWGIPRFGATAGH
jgi:hypothetical protein